MKTIEDLYFSLPNSGFKDEASFTTWFGKQIKNNGGLFWKLSDMDIRRKPFDAFMQYDGLSAAIEFKKGKNKNTVNLYNLLEPNQIVGLEKYQKNKGNALIIYYSTLHNKYFVRHFEHNITLKIDI